MIEVRKINDDEISDEGLAGTAVGRPALAGVKTPCIATVHAASSRFLRQRQLERGCCRAFPATTLFPPAVSRERAETALSGVAPVQRCTARARLGLGFGLGLGFLGGGTTAALGRAAASGDHHHCHSPSSSGSQGPWSCRRRGRALAHFHVAA